MNESIELHGCLLLNMFIMNKLICDYRKTEKCALVLLVKIMIINPILGQFCKQLNINDMILTFAKWASSISKNESVVLGSGLIVTTMILELTTV